MKEALRRGRFSSDEVKGAVQKWLKTQPKSLLSDRIKKNCEMPKSVC
jgi:hypothetical protein